MWIAKEPTTQLNSNADGSLKTNTHHERWLNAYVSIGISMGLTARAAAKMGYDTGFNKNHNEYMSYFKNITSLTTIDIPNQPNAIKGKKLKQKLNKFPNINYKESIQDAIKSIPVSNNDVILITGSLYLAGEVLNLN